MDIFTKLCPYLDGYFLKIFPPSYAHIWVDICLRYFHPAVLIFQRKRFEQQQQAWDLPRASRDCLVRPKIISNVLLSLFHTATFVPCTLLESCIRACPLIVWSGLEYRTYWFFYYSDSSVTLHQILSKNKQNTETVCLPQHLWFSRRSFVCLTFGLVTRGINSDVVE